MEQEVNYIYRLAPSGGSPIGLINLTARGMGTIFSKEHPELRAYLLKHPGNQCLYLPVGEGNARHTTPEEFYNLRDFSIMMCLNPLLVNRLLTVRTEWSKK